MGLALAGGLMLAGCGPGPTPTSTTTTTLSPPSTAEGTPLRWDNLLNPHVAPTPAGLFLTWQVSPPGGGTPVSEIARADPTSGALSVHRSIQGWIGDVVEAAGSLWVVTFSPGTDTLVRMSPTSLATLGHWQIATVPNGEAAGGTEAVAGGSLWVAAGPALVKVPLAQLRPTASVSLPGAVRSEVTANSAGTEMVVSEAGSSGAGRIERRNPATGSVIATRPASGVTAAKLGGIAGETLWVAEPSGTMGMVEALGVANLSAAPLVKLAATNAGGAWVKGGAVYVTQITGIFHANQVERGPGKNYCANATNGSFAAALPMPLSGQVLAVGAGHFYYATAATTGNRQDVHQALIPKACPGP